MILIKNLDKQREFENRCRPKPRWIGYRGIKNHKLGLSKILKAPENNFT
jgi:hypothetical protein